MKISIFTPTYNRAYTLGALYESLRKQTCQDFEWIIVDDGSTDNTEELCRGFYSYLFPIHYFKIPNHGKHIAINFEIQKALGEWFFIVDSDDQLPEHSIENIKKESEKISDKKDIAVLCGMKFYKNGERVGGNLNFKEIDCSALDFRYKYHIKGDAAEAIRTTVIKKYPFPEFDDERFCPEALLFNRIARKYKTHYFNKNVYLCEYLTDGLSAKITKIRMNSWKGT